MNGKCFKSQDSGVKRQGSRIKFWITHLVWATWCAFPFCTSISAAIELIRFILVGASLVVKEVVLRVASLVPRVVVGVALQVASPVPRVAMEVVLQVARLVPRVVLPVASLVPGVVLRVARLVPRVPAPVLQRRGLIVVTMVVTSRLRSSRRLWRDRGLIVVTMSVTPPSRIKARDGLRCSRRLWQDRGHIAVTMVVTTGTPWKASLIRRDCWRSWRSEQASIGIAGNRVGLVGRWWWRNVFCVQAGRFGRASPLRIERRGDPR